MSSTPTAIEITRGDLFAVEVEAIVNPVNTRGVMGKGLALAFKKKFPDAFRAYAKACERGEVVVGQMHVVERESKPHYIIHFPTKDDWRAPSRLECVRDGLLDLAREIREREIQSIAIPALGCGLGGLAWGDVRPLIVAALDGVEARVILFEPS
jgi:O-acetyl-ADP-ribose deacetylase (regulator of RNase III)